MHVIYVLVLVKLKNNTFKILTGVAYLTKTVCSIISLADTKYDAEKRDGSSNADILAFLCTMYVFHGTKS